MDLFKFPHLHYRCLDILHFVVDRQWFLKYLTEKWADIKRSRFKSVL